MFNGSSKFGRKIVVKMLQNKGREWVKNCNDKSMIFGPAPHHIIKLKQKIKKSFHFYHQHFTIYLPLYLF